MRLTFQRFLSIVATIASAYGMIDSAIKKQFFWYSVCFVLLVLNIHFLKKDFEKKDDNGEV